MSSYKPQIGLIKKSRAVYQSSITTYSSSTTTYSSSTTQYGGSDTKKDSYPQMGVIKTYL